MRQILINIASNRILQHTLFWMLSFWIFAYTYKVSATIQTIDYIYSFFFHVSLVVAVYVNLEVLIPKFLQRQRFGLYIIGLLLILVVAVNINQFTFGILTDLILSDYFFISYFEFVDLAKIIAIYILITSLIKLSKSWFLLQEMNLKVATSEKEQVATELKALKAQINPHFLFNSLNVLYSLALKKSKESPDAIIKLSDILRYIIYESEHEYVPLKKEIAMIHNYLDLQRYRIDCDSLLNVDIKMENENFKIAPLLILPLIENSFKHGIKGELRNTYINIHLQQKNSQFWVEIENNLGKCDEPEGKSGGGIGLKNIRSRLDIIYPKCHDFNIVETEKSFKVSLNIKNK